MKKKEERRGREDFSAKGRACESHRGMKVTNACEYTASILVGLCGIVKCYWMWESSIPEFTTQFRFLLVARSVKLLNVSVS